MRNIFTLLSLLVFWLNSLEARPGMGNSYRSSSSSSSSSRSSYSSYKPSSSSSSSSSKSKDSSSSYSTSSGPEPTSYFETKNHTISIHFHEDGSADVKETFHVLKDQSKIGIRRPSILIQKEAEISDLVILPESIYSSHNAGTLTLFWSNNEQNPEMDISVSYKIKEAFVPLGKLSLVNWRITKTNHASEPFQLDLRWDPNSFSKDLRIQKEVFNSSLLEYERISIPVSFEDFHFFYQTKEKDESADLIVIGMLNQIPNQSSEKNISNHSNSHDSVYTLEETVTLKANGSHFYSSKIQIPNKNPNLDQLQFQLGLNRFHESGESTWNQFWMPAFQISYGFEGLTTYFWHLFSVSLSEGSDGPNEKKNYQFSYHTLGEGSNRMENGIERWIRITKLERSENLELDSFSLRVLCEETCEPNLTELELVFTACDYCSDLLDKSSLFIPVQPKWETDGFTILWQNPLPSQYAVSLRMREKNKEITYNPLLIYYAVLNAFMHSPGSGNHTGYLFSIGIFFVLIGLTGLYVWKRKKKQKREKQTFKSFVSEIKKFDVNFDFNLFKEKVTTITEKTVLAWNNGDMEPVRNFLSAAVFQRFFIQLHLMKDVDGEVNRMKDFSVLSVQIIDFSIESDYLTLHLKLKCKTKDNTFAKQTSELDIQKNLDHIKFSTYEEIHSYTRKVNTVTKPKIDLIHDLCPSCGASAKFSHSTNKCEYCGGIFNSGEADWVLTEITQTVEWDSAKNPKLKSLPENVAKQILEDRATTIFWKWLHFQSIQGSQILKRESTNETNSELGEPGKEPMHSPVVGSCHLVKYENHLVPEMTCEIRWSVARKKGLVPEHRRSHIRLVLPKERPKSIGFSELSCENCGAPLPEVDVNECSYCRKPIPKVISDWLFHSIKMVSL
ncbi:TIM44-like domain-containing protein [Leptospira jelokensis]|uniref:Transport protein n=1 Tax=Leptospira jelokensis TaxID=2484931 RepID=A0A4Z0ZTF5_9LEPT|nr:TIM44-like domain-containing protein [Leptospira jelokensis]TGL65622.1 transport protein [Leptospira jelokensis]